MRDQGGHTRRAILRALGGATGLALGAPAARLMAAAGVGGPEGPPLRTPLQGSSPQGAPPAAADAAGTLRLADDLFLIRIPGQANVVAQTGPDGVLLVDGVSATATDGLMQAVAALPGGGKVHTLFNTHWHPEQTGSNERLAAQGAAIVAHENTRLWLTTDVAWPWNGQRFKRLPKSAQPNKTFYTTGALPDGVRYGHIADAAHTDGDLYVYFPQQNVLAVGDVLSADGWPVVDWVSGGWIGGLVGGIQRLQTIANDGTRIVPSRGPVMSIADLKAHATMYGTIYDRLTQLLNKGRGPSEAVAAKPAKEYEAEMGNPDEFVRRAFESLWAYLSPDA